MIAADYAQWLTPKFHALVDGSCHLLTGLGRIDHAIRRGESPEQLLLLIEAISIEYGAITKELKE